MKYKKEWEEAIRDYNGVTLDDLYDKSKSYVISRSFKIEKNKKNINIYKFIGYFWSEINEEEYKLVVDKGWVVSTILMSLNKISEDLKSIEYKIRKDMNTRKNNKYLVALKKKRGESMQIYSSLLKQLNKTNYGKQEIKLSETQGEGCISIDSEER